MNRKSGQVDYIKDWLMTRHGPLEKAEMEVDQLCSSGENTRTETSLIAYSPSLAAQYAAS